MPHPGHPGDLPPGEGIFAGSSSGSIQLGWTSLWLVPDPSFSCAVQHPFGQLEFALPGVPPLTPDAAIELELKDIANLSLPRAIELQLRLSDSRTIPDRVKRIAELEATEGTVPAGRDYWSSTGGEEVLWLLDDAIIAYVAGAFLATLVCCHAACERELAGCLSVSQTRYGQLPKNWDRWGLGLLIREAHSRGIVSDGLYRELSVVNDSRRATAHFKHPLEPTSLRNRVFAAAGPDRTVPGTAFGDQMRSDALSAYRATFRLLRGRGEGFDSFDSLLPRTGSSEGGDTAVAGGSTP